MYYKIQKAREASQLTNTALYVFYLMSVKL